MARKINRVIYATELVAALARRDLARILIAWENLTRSREKSHN